MNRNDSVLYMWVLEFSLSPVAYAEPVLRGMECIKWIIANAKK